MTENPSDRPNRLGELLKALSKLDKSEKSVSTALKRRFPKQKPYSASSLSRYSLPTRTTSPVTAELVSLIEQVYQDLFINQIINFDQATNTYIVKEAYVKKGTGTSSGIAVQTLENLLNHTAITEAVSKGVKTLRILDTWLPYMLHGRDVLLKEWAQKAEKIQILILEPASDGLRLRAEALNIEFKTVQKQVIENLEMILKMADEFRGKCNIEVRLYDSLPTVNLFLVDDIAFYGLFLQNGYSQNHFFNRTEGSASDNYVIKQLASHFDAIWEKSAKDGKVDRNKVNNLKRQVTEKITRIEMLHTSYWLYYVQEREGKRYLQANVFHTHSVSKCALVYYNPFIKSGIYTTGKVKIVGETGNLVLSFTGSTFFLEVLLPTLVAFKPQTVPVTLLQIDQLSGKPVASLGFLVKKESGEGNNQAAEPFELLMDEKKTLEDTRIPPKVVQALQREFAQTLRHHTSPPTQLQEWPEPYEDQIIDRLRSTDWQVYFPEHMPKEGSEMEKLNLRHDVLMAIGTTRVRFSLGAGGALVIEAEAPSHAKMKGVAYVVEIGAYYYLHCHLKSRRNILNQIIIRLERDFISGNSPKMAGIYNLVYTDGTLGCGFLMAEPLSDAQDNSRQVFHPLDLLQQHADLDAALGFRDEGSLLWPPGRRRENCIYEGVYEVFTYGRHRVNNIETKCIIRSVLRIHSNRFVEFKGNTPDREASGKVRMVLNNIYISLKNSSSTSNQPRRQGFFFFAVKENMPETNDLYGGVFSGLCSASQPLSKRTILRFRGNDEMALAMYDNYDPKTARIDIYSKEYDELDEEVRKALTGRLINYIGFQLGGNPVTPGALERYNRDELPLAQMFLDAALYRAAKAKSTKEVEETLQVLRQAFNHGWNDLASFEEAIQQHEKGAEILRSKIYTDLKKTLNDEI